MKFDFSIWSRFVIYDCMYVYIFVCVCMCLNVCIYKLCVFVCVYIL